MIRNILIATDGSETAMKAAEYAAGLAKQTGATVTALSVVDESIFMSKSVPGAATPTHLTEPIGDYLRQAAAGYLEATKDLCGKHGIQVKTLIRSGHPVQEIIWEAEESGTDLIVVGSRGRSALLASVIGSVAYGVVHRETKIPVLIVRG